MAWSAGSLGVLALTAPALAAAPQRTEVAPKDRRTSDEVVLLVVDRGGRPLPEAEVRFAVEDEKPGAVRDPSVPGGWRQALRLENMPAPGLVDALLAHRPVVRPDASGEVRCSLPGDRGLLVEAGCGELWGFRWFPRDWRETAGRAHPEGEPLRLELVPDWPLVVQVLDDAGYPLDRATVRLRCGGWGRSHTGEGELRSPHLGYELRGESEPLVVTLDALLSPPVRATLDPRRPPAGPVVLRMPACGSVHVQVLEPDGRPSEKTCRISLRLVPEPAPASGRRFEPSGRQPGVGVLAVKGSATVDGVSLGREIGISLGDDGAVAETRIPGPVRPGETVEVDLRKGPGTPDRAEPVLSRAVPEPAPSGELEGFVLLDPAIPPDELDVRVQPRSGGAPCHATALGRDGRFTLSGLPPGPAELEIRARAAREAVFALEVEVVPGASADPRLAALDLRGKLFAHSIALSGLDPERPFHARAFFRPASQWTPTPCYLRAWELPLVIVAPWRAIDVDVYVPGRRSVSLLAVSGREEVALEPALPVRLVLKTDGALPAPPRVLKAVLAPLDVPGVGIDWEGPAFGPERELRTIAWGPGRMQVRWIVAEYAEDLSSGGGTSPEVWPPQYVDVQDSPLEQVFEVSISAAELARILAE